jgi:hypothetical protein
VHAAGTDTEIRFLYTRKRMKGIPHTGVITRMSIVADTGIAGMMTSGIVDSLMAMEPQGTPSPRIPLPKGLVLGWERLF